MASDVPKSSSKKTATTTGAEVEANVQLETDAKAPSKKKTKSSSRKTVLSARPKAKARAKSAASSADPVRVYLRDMGQVSLLSREGEVEIAKRIEAGTQDKEFGILGNAHGLAAVLELGERFRQGEIELSSAVDGLNVEGSPSAEERAQTLEEALRRVASPVSYTHLTLPTKA